MTRKSILEIIEYLRMLETGGVKVLHVYALKDKFGVSMSSLKVLLWRASKRGLINRIGKVWITLPHVQPHEILPLLYPPSCISMEWALHYHGVSVQKPFVVTAVSTKKTKTIKSNTWSIEVHHIKKELFFGFDDKYIAYPEKALLDLAYIRRRIEFELDFTEIDKRVLKKYLMKYPRFVRKVLKSYNLV